MAQTIQDFYNTLFTKDTQYNYDTFLLRKFQDFLSQQEDTAEVWKPIQGYSGWYYVSTYGNVLSLKDKAPRILKPQNKGEYYYVDLEGDQKKIHQLVAKTFLTNTDKKPVVHHKDHNKQNNKLENLQFATYKENADYYQQQRKKVNNAEIVLSAVSTVSED